MQDRPGSSRRHPPRQCGRRTGRQLRPVGRARRTSRAMLADPAGAEHMTTVPPVCRTATRGCGGVRPWPIVAALSSGRRVTRVRAAPTHRAVGHTGFSRAPEQWRSPPKCGTSRLRTDVALRRNPCAVPRAPSGSRLPRRGPGRDRLRLAAVVRRRQRGERRGGTVPPGETRRTRWSRRTPMRSRAARSWTMLFRGLKRLQPEDGQRGERDRRPHRDEGPAELHRQAEDGWNFRNGTQVTATSFVDAWNYGALLDQQAEERAFFPVHRGLREGAPRRQGKPEGQDDVGAEGRRRQHLHRQAQPEVLQLAGHAGLLGLHAAARVVLQGPRGLRARSRSATARTSSWSSYAQGPI